MKWFDHEIGLDKIGQGLVLNLKASDLNLETSDLNLDTDDLD